MSLLPLQTPDVIAASAPRYPFTATHIGSRRTDHRANAQRRMKPGRRHFLLCKLKTKTCPTG
jgi:hypothetical protein